jgi:hypothetical protein
LNKYNIISNVSITDAVQIDMVKESGK